MAVADEEVDVDSLFGGGSGEGDDIPGTPDDDILVGTPGNDAIYGFAGFDVIIGGGGNDLLGGGVGPDWLIFDNGEDTGDDLVTGFTRSDLILFSEQLDSDTVELTDEVLEIEDGSIEIPNVASIVFDSMVEFDGAAFFAYAVGDFTVGQNLIYLESSTFPYG